MQTNDCTEPEARKILESASLHRNVAQHEVAETILRALVINEPRTGT
jgi:AmiR/NasT family two-component response regulator